MSCIKISAYVPTLPAHLTDNGVFYFETDLDFDIKVAKYLNQLTILQQIRIDGFYSFELQSGCKNDILLFRFIDPHSLNLSPINVRVSTGSTEFNYYSLTVTDFVDKKYQCELKVSEDHWIKKMQKLKLNQIDFNDSNPFVFNAANIISQNNLNEYLDNTLGVRFPVVNYGKFVDKANGLRLGDFRPHLFMLYVLQKAFCQVGWKFRSTIFESQFGRRLICYLLDKEYGIDGNDLANYNVNALQPTNKILTSKTAGEFFKVEFDLVNAGSSANYSLGKFSSAGIFDVYCSVNFTARKFAVHAGKKYVDVTLQLAYYKSGNRFVLEEKTETIGFTNITSYPANKVLYTYDLTFEKLGVQIDAGDHICLEYSFNYRNGSENQYEMKIESITNTANQLIITAKKIFLQEGSNLIFSRIIRDDQVIDFIKGCLHLVNGKIHTDFVKKEVWIYPSENTEVENENIEGYFVGDENIDISEIIDCDSVKVSISKKTNHRYERFKYKGAGDGAIKYFTEDKGNDYHAYKVDFGEQYEENTIDNSNPYFEATYNGLVAGIDQLAGMEIIVPFMMPEYNENESKSYYDIQPRVLYWHGMIVQRQYLEGLSYPNDYVWPSYIYLDLPYTRMPIALSDTNGRYFGAGNAAFPIETTLAYGEKNKDLFTTFYQRWLYHTIYNKEYELLVYFTAAFFNKYDFRNTVTFNILGRTTIGRVIEILDYSLCLDGYVPTKVIPIVDSDNCSVIIPNNGDTGALLCQGNSPTLIVTFNDPCYLFSISGTNSSVVTSVEYYYRLNSETTWTLANQLCSPTEGFNVRMVVYYLDCPSLIRTKYVDVCGNSPELTATFNYANNCFNAELDGLITSDIDQIVYTYSVDNGVTFLPYTYPNCQVVPNTTTEIIIRAIVSYDDICDDSILEETLFIDIEPNECEIEIDVECTSTGSLIRTGANVQNAVDIIYWKQILTDQWKIYDEVSNLPCPFYYRRVVILCGVNCPPICTDAKLCECSGCNENFTITCVSQVLSVNSTNCTITWTGPNSFAASGNNVAITTEGLYTATIVCGNCTYVETYNFNPLSAGDDTTIDIDDEGNII